MAVDRQVKSDAGKWEQWYVWQPATRARLVNQLSRKALENTTIADLYWRQRERRAVVRTRAARRAMENRHVWRAYWRYRDNKAQSRSRRS